MQTNMQDVAVILGLLGTPVGIAVWVFTTFTTLRRHESLEKRVNHQEATLNKVATDVAYIRGRLEPKGE